MNRRLIPSPAFTRAAKQSAHRNPAIAEAIRRTLRLLEADAFNPKLRTHKLKGNLAGCWASSAGYDLRIIFEFIVQGDSEAIFLLTVGTHDEVY